MRGVSSNWDTAWMLRCFHMSSAKAVSSLILIAVSLKFSRPWQNADRFFFFLPENYMNVLLTPFQIGYLFPLWSFMSQAFTVNLPQHPGFPNSHHHGLLRYAFSSLMPQTPAANQFQSHGRVYHGNSPTYCYQFSVLVIFPIAYKSNSKKERFISAPG